MDESKIVRIFLGVSFLILLILSIFYIYMFKVETKKLDLCIKGINENEVVDITGLGITPKWGESNPIAEFEREKKKVLNKCKEEIKELENKYNLSEK